MKIIAHEYADRAWLEIGDSRSRFERRVAIALKLGNLLNGVDDFDHALHMLGAKKHWQAGNQRRMCLYEAAAELGIANLDFKRTTQFQSIERNARAVRVEAFRA